MTEDPDLVRYLLLLRFGDEAKAHLSAPLLNYASISKVVKKPLQTVRTLILLGVEAMKRGQPIHPRVRTKFSEQHIDYLVS